MSIIKTASAAWKRRFQLDDVTGVFKVSTPGSTVRDPNNPLRVTKTEAGIVTYEPILGGWLAISQEFPEGLRIDNKNGKCVIPMHLLAVTYDQFKTNITSTGINCFFNDEQVNITLVQYDPLADAVVISIARVET